MYKLIRKKTEKKMLEFYIIFVLYLITQNAYKMKIGKK